MIIWIAYMLILIKVNINLQIGGIIINSNLRDILRKYEIKREIAVNDLEKRKKELFAKVPRLQELEDNLNKFSIKTVKSILITGGSNEKSKLINDLNLEIQKLKAEKLAILESINLDENYLKPKYECSLCNDTGYIITNHSNKMCNCLKQELLNLSYNKSNLNRLDKENFSTFNFNKFSDDINFDKYNVNISPRDNMKNILKIVKNFIYNFNDYNEKNLLFTGNTGLGKTFLSNCIANEVLNMNKTVLYQTAPIMLDSIIDYRFNKNEGEIYKEILSVDLLIIDDLGTESINSMKFTELFNIINSRILSNQKTVISTNLSVNELLKNYDERIFSRFAGHYNICRFFGDDIRLQK